MAKKITGYIKLQIKAGKANPAPPVGPALGQKGLNIMEFCKAFNAKTQGVDPEAKVPVVITVYKDKTFSFICKKPPVSYYLRKAAGIKSGSGTPGRSVVGSLTFEDLRNIAKEKMEDMNTQDLDAAVLMIKGSALSMGIQIKQEEES